MSTRFCPKCQTPTVAATARWLKAPTEYAWVHHYQCDTCRHAWHVAINIPKATPQSRTGDAAMLTSRVG